MRSFGIDHAFNMLAANSTGGKRGNCKESEAEQKAPPQGPEAGRTKAAYQREPPDRIG
jgi:hypothetical protein